MNDLRVLTEEEFIKRSDFVSGFIGMTFNMKLLHLHDLGEYSSFIVMRTLQVSTL